MSIQLSDIEMPNKCTKCLYDNNHPFGLSLYKNGCSGCDTHGEKYEIDWDKKREELEEIIIEAKKKSTVYDCVVPVVGDAEDYYVISKVLEVGLNPLVVSVNDYFKNDIGWHNLHQLITYFDVDSMVYNPDVRVYKDLVRTSLRKYNHILLPFLQLHSSYPVHIAKDRKIPLIIWGQNQAVEQVGKFSHHDKVEMSQWSRKEHDLFGTDIYTLIGNGAQVNTRYLNYYKYPNISSPSIQKVRGIYLSNYFKWDPLRQNQSTIKFGFTPQVNSSSFDIYERVGSSVYYDFHDLLKLKRLGYRKIRDHLVREIRHGRATKKDAIKIESQYNTSKVDVYKFFKWLDMSQSGMDWFVKHRLNGFENIIGSQSKVDVDIPIKIKNLLGVSELQSEDFIAYGKGLEI